MTPRSLRMVNTSLLLATVISSSSTLVRGRQSGPSQILQPASMPSHGRLMAITSPCVVDGKVRQQVLTCTNSMEQVGLVFGKRQPQPHVLRRHFHMTVLKWPPVCTGTVVTVRPHEFTNLIPAFKSIRLMARAPAVVLLATTTNADNWKASHGAQIILTS